MSVIVDLTAATICFLGQCFPVLTGINTPVGTFFMTERLTQERGYSGNVIQFFETEDKVYAIHRTWKLNSAQRREERLLSNNPRDRLITNGCINVNEVVFEQLLECCIETELKIVK